MKPKEPNKKITFNADDETLEALRKLAGEAQATHISRARSVVIRRAIIEAAARMGTAIQRKG